MQDELARLRSATDQRREALLLWSGWVGALAALAWVMLVLVLREAPEHQLVYSVACLAMAVSATCAAASCLTAALVARLLVERDLEGSTAP